MTAAEVRTGVFRKEAVDHLVAAAQDRAEIIPSVIPMMWPLSAVILVATFVLVTAAAFVRVDETVVGQTVLKLSQRVVPVAAGISPADVEPSVKDGAPVAAGDSVRVVSGPAMGARFVADRPGRWLVVKASAGTETLVFVPSLVGLEVGIWVPEAAVDGVKTNQPVTVAFGPPGAKTAQGHVTRVDRTASTDAVGGLLFRVEVTIDTEPSSVAFSRDVKSTISIVTGSRSVLMTVLAGTHREGR
jgi:hypothetical protein